MNPARKAIVAAAMFGSMLTGGAVGVALLGPAAATAQTTSTTAPAASSSTAPTGTPPAVGHSNEDPTHEAGESAAREAAEDNGTATYGPPAPSSATTG